MGERDPPQPAARVHRRHHPLEVLAQGRPRVDHVGGVAVHDPRVGARQRERPGVVGAQAQHVEGRQPSRLGDRVHREARLPRQRQVELRGGFRHPLALGAPVFPAPGPRARGAAAVSALPPLPIPAALEAGGVRDTLLGVGAGI